MLDINKIRKEFPILGTTVHSRRLVYLDTAATAQKPRVVIDTVNELHRSGNANIHRGIHYLSQHATSRYEEARETVRAFINARSAKEIIFTAGATASINLVAYSFGEKFVGSGDNILLTEMEHHSNIVPWQLLAGRKGAEIRVVPFDDDGKLLTEKLAGLIDARTRIVAVTQTSNVTGTNPDLAYIIETAHKAGVPVLVDGCQGIVHHSVDIAALDADFYVFSGHKLYGPTGIGVLYGKEKWLEQMPPFLGGGDMVGTVSFAGTTYAELPLKFEAGTSNFIGATGLAAAIEWLRGIGNADIAAHENRLLEHTTGKLLSAVEGIRIYGTTPGKSPIVSFTAEGTHPADIGMIVDKAGVAIRTGTHCADTVMAHYGIDAMCRISFGLYNDLGDADTAVEAVATAVKMLRR